MQDIQGLVSHKEGVPSPAPSLLRNDSKCIFMFSTINSPPQALRLQEDFLHILLLNIINTSLTVIYHSVLLISFCSGKHFRQRKTQEMKWIKKKNHVAFPTSSNKFLEISKTIFFWAVSKQLPFSHSKLISIKMLQNRELLLDNNIYTYTRASEIHMRQREGDHSVWYVIESCVNRGHFFHNTHSISHSNSPLWDKYWCFVSSMFYLSFLTHWPLGDVTVMLKQ